MIILVLKTISAPAEKSDTKQTEPGPSNEHKGKGHESSDDHQGQVSFRVSLISQAQLRNITILLSSCFQNQRSPVVDIKAP